jgi:hypothetical protein
MKGIIPKEFRDFALEFSNKRKTLDIGNYVSDYGTFKIEYLNVIPYSSQFPRICVFDYRIQVSKSQSDKISPQTLFFLLNQIFLLLYLKDSYGYCGESQYFNSDFISLLKCNKEKMNVKNIIKEAAQFLIESPCELNKKRVMKFIDILNFAIK